MFDRTNERPIDWLNQPNVRSFIRSLFVRSIDVSITCLFSICKQASNGHILIVHSFIRLFNCLFHRSIDRTNERANGIISSTMLWPIQFDCISQSVVLGISHCTASTDRLIDQSIDWSIGRSELAIAMQYRCIAICNAALLHCNGFWINHSHGQPTDSINGLTMRMV